MRTHVQLSTRTRKQACLVGVAILSLARFCFGQAAISLSAASGPPTTNVRVSGSGFAPHAKIDIYFGKQNEAVAMADGSGSFSQIAISAPALALPGTHWVSAVERAGRVGSQVSFTVQSDWTEFHKPNMMRWNGVENVLNVGNVKNLRLKWSYNGSGSDTFSPPVVANGVVYVGSGASNVSALEASTGSLLWKYDTSSGMLTSPAVANGVVYAGSFDGDVYALNATTGTLVWTYTTGGGISSAPAVANGLLYIQSADGYLYALNATTGAKLWSYLTGTYDCCIGFVSSPAIVNGLVYIGSEDNNIYALNATTGALRWKYTTGAQITSSPAIANGVVYDGSEDGKVYALNANSGALLWQYTALSYPVSPAVANGVVYFGAPGKEYALNATTGARLWTYTTSRVFTSALANGVDYFSSSDKMYALNASTGAKLWSYPLDFGSVAPVVVDGMVYIDSYYNVYAFGLPGSDEGGRASDSKAPSLKTLRPNFNLKVSLPVTTAAAETD